MISERLDAAPLESLHRMVSILLVDNKAQPIAGELGPILQGKGFQFDFVPELQHVKESLSGQNPDIILINGCESGSATLACSNEFRTDASTEKLPLVVLSREDLPKEQLTKLFDSGVQDCINVSTDMDGLPERLKLVIRQARRIHQLESLASQLNDLNNELYERNTRVEKELYTTRQLQQSLLPPYIDDEDCAGGSQLQGKTVEHTGANQLSNCHFANERIRVSGLYLPCDSLGGDMYDVIPFKDDVLGVAIVDVSGHGVPAAFITAIFKSSFYRITLQHDKPNDILFHLNNELSNLIKTGEYLTGFYCRILNDGRTLEFSGAGHPYPIHYHAATNTITRMEENGLPMVWMKDMDYPLGISALEPGDKILIFTDGITELKNPSKAIFGEPALEELFLNLINNQSGLILDDIIEKLSDYSQGHPLEDDLSLVLIEVL
jgi:sigma-B regulation protein RsbU (phosphoserine phosphatase)